MTRTAKIIVIMFFCLTGLLTVEQKAASAQSALEKNVIYGQDKIGTYQNELEQSADPSVSVVGVKVRLKQSLGYDVITYAADTWNKTADGTWKYIGTEVDGEQGQFGSMVHSYSSINILGYTSPRFGIITGMMRNYMSKKLPEEYSVVTRKIVRGTETSRTTQYSFQTQEQLVKQKDSLLHALRGNGEAISVCEHVATGTSYEYTIYPHKLLMFLKRILLSIRAVAALSRLVQHILMVLIIICINCQNCVHQQDIRWIWKAGMTKSRGNKIRRGFFAAYE